MMSLTLVNFGTETHSHKTLLQARYNVELEIILPRDMTVQESHDLSLELQHKVSEIIWARYKSFIFPKRSSEP